MMCYYLNVQFQGQRVNGAPKYEGIINAGEVWTLVWNLMCVIYMSWHMKPNMLQV